MAPKCFWFGLTTGLCGERTAHTHFEGRERERGKGCLNLVCRTELWCWVCGWLVAGISQGTIHFPTFPEIYRFIQNCAEKFRKCAESDFLILARKWRRSHLSVCLKMTQSSQSLFSRFWRTTIWQGLLSLDDFEIKFYFLNFLFALFKESLPINIFTV